MTDIFGVYYRSLDFMSFPLHSLESVRKKEENECYMSFGLLIFLHGHFGPEHKNSLRNHKFKVPQAQQPFCVSDHDKQVGTFTLLEVPEVTH